MTAEIQYMHFRPLNIEVNSHGGATVAILPNDVNGKAIISIARCNPNDVFNKKTGRLVASGRIMAALKGRDMGDKVRTITIGDCENLKESVASVIGTEMEEFGLY